MDTDVVTSMLDCILEEVLEDTVQAAFVSFDHPKVCADIEFRRSSRHIPPRFGGTRRNIDWLRFPNYLHFFRERSYILDERINPFERVSDLL